LAGGTQRQHLAALRSGWQLGPHSAHGGVLGAPLQFHLVLRQPPTLCCKVQPRTAAAAAAAAALAASSSGRHD
jgi:hypothetical protein